MTMDFILFLPTCVIISIWLLMAASYSFPVHQTEKENLPSVKIAPEKYTDKVTIINLLKQKQNQFRRIL